MANSLAISVYRPPVEVVKAEAVARRRPTTIATTTEAFATAWWAAGPPVERRGERAIK
jgi:hypothetical protein